MTTHYQQDFGRLKHLSFQPTKELGGRLLEGILHVEVAPTGKFTLTLESPKIPSRQPSSEKDLLTQLSAADVDFLRVFAEQNSSETPCRIEFWKNSRILNSTIHCRAIRDLPTG
jgi:hypothetical protein